MDVSKARKIYQPVLSLISAITIKKVAIGSRYLLPTTYYLLRVGGYSRA
jgi:hypothetical protein